MIVAQREANEKPTRSLREAHRDDPREVWQREDSQREDSQREVWQREDTLKS